MSRLTFKKERKIKRQEIKKIMSLTVYKNWKILHKKMMLSIWGLSVYSIITTIAIIFLLVGCASHHEPDETEIMNTVCIDGYKHLSVTSGFDCFYHKLDQECGK